MDCSICYSKSENIGVLESCDHCFCLSCINSWTEFSNKCPLCRLPFSKIAIKNDNNFIQYKIVGSKNLKTYLSNSEYYNYENSNDYCYVCKLENEQHKMIICDNCNLKCCHLYCFSPPIFNIPEGNWYCDFCLIYYKIEENTISSNYIDINSYRRYLINVNNNNSIMDNNYQLPLNQKKKNKGFNNKYFNYF